MDITSKQRLIELIFNAVDDGILVLDRNYRVLDLNKSMGRWTEKPVSEIRGEDCKRLFHDSGSICPHCAAQVVFETGKVHTITQEVTLKGANLYAKLSAYPMKDETGDTTECVIYIQDITESIISLGIENNLRVRNEYLEGIIENTADAIITADFNGIVTSWNKGAETIYGFTEGEVLGKYLPFVPDFLVDIENAYIGRMKKGETIKHIESVRKRKDGSIVEVSLTMSPIKTTNGEVIGFSCISRDIAARKTIERELINRNQELSRLFFISSAMRGTLDLDRLLRMVLAAVTMGDGLGFNRAILFLVDKENILKGAMGIGHMSHEEAYQIWDRISLEKKTLSDIMIELETGPLQKDSLFDRLSRGIEVSLTDNTVLSLAVKEKRQFNIQDVKEEPLSDTVLDQQLGTYAYAVSPLISRDKVIGIIWVDNLINRRPISEEDMRFLTAFSNHVASAIESARLFERIALAEQELEDIFESISDMVYFITDDYVVRNINKAVSKRIGKPPEEIIGKKCYEVFHGSNEPSYECPHHRTVVEKKAYVKEIEDPYLGGTFIVSSSPIFDAAGKSIGTVNVISDISELKSLRERFILTARMAALGEVAARVAHEIRNPLVSLGGFARRLQKSLKGNLKEYADIIAKEVGRLEGILNEILGFVKETRIMKEVVNANKLIDDITLLIKPEIDEKNIIFVKEFGEPVEIYVDLNRIKEAFINILTNSVQAVSSKGTIVTKTFIKNHSFVIEIRDSGVGINENDLPFIFDPFFTTKQMGTGLGLTIAHRIIEEHEGRVEVESKPGIGSTFRVFIPLNRNNEENAIKKEV